MSNYRDSTHALKSADEPGIMGTTIATEQRKIAAVQQLAKKKILVTAGDGLPPRLPAGAKRAEGSDSR